MVRRQNQTQHKEEVMTGLYLGTHVLARVGIESWAAGPDRNTVRDLHPLPEGLA